MVNKIRLKKIIRELAENLGRGLNHDEACQFSEKLKEDSTESKFVQEWFGRCERGEDKKAAFLRTFVSQGVREDKDASIVLDELLLESFKNLIGGAGDPEVGYFGSCIVSEMRTWG